VVVQLSQRAADAALSHVQGFAQLDLIEPAPCRVRQVLRQHEQYPQRCAAGDFRRQRGGFLGERDIEHAAKALPRWSCLGHCHPLACVGDQPDNLSAGHYRLPP
jgi:hypothetical protein